MKEKKIDNEISYSISDILPYKLLKNSEAVAEINSGHLPMLHVQLVPTNRCNLSCSYCTFKERDRQDEMPIDKVIELVPLLARAGVKAITITGGGEPLVHPHINEIITLFSDAGMKIGLVTNGKALDKLTTGDKITWCRISHADDRTFDEEYQQLLSSVMTRYPMIDWAMSYVVTCSPKYEQIEAVMNFANTHALTHVRFVADLFDVSHVPMIAVKWRLEDSGIDGAKAIYQPRDKYEVGGDCYIGFIRPFIDADFNVYACCGATFAFNPPPKFLPKQLCLGSAFDIEQIIKRSNIPVDGSICARCYYMNYNRVLKNMLSDVDHEDFV